MATQDKSESAEQRKARRTGRKRKRWLAAYGRSLEITKSGWLFILACLAVGFVSINSGSNLMHIIFGAQLGLIVASGALSELMLGRVKVRLHVLGHPHAEQSCPVELEIENTHTKAAAMAISVLRDADLPAEAEIDTVFAPTIPAASTVRLRSTLRFDERGQASAPPMVVRTGYPFGLFVKRRRLEQEFETIVFPAIAHGLPAQAVSKAEQHDEARKIVSQHIDRSPGEEFHAHAEYREGENPDLIDWRASARRNRLIVARYEAKDEETGYIELNPGQRGDKNFEASVSQAAGRSLELAAGGARALGLKYGGQTLIPPGYGRGHMLKLLGRLALIGDKA